MARRRPGDPQSHEQRVDIIRRQMQRKADFAAWTAELSADEAGSADRNTDDEEPS